MKVKETIAFIGEVDETGRELIRKLAAASYPMVLVAKEDNQLEVLYRHILDHIPQADIEAINCEMEGCWEADIIIISNTTEIDPELLQRIEVVANQKIMLYFSEKNTPVSFWNGVEKVKKLLPNVNWVVVIPDSITEKMHIHGETTAAEIVANILNKVDYKVSCKLNKTIEQ